MKNYLFVLFTFILGFLACENEPVGPSKNTLKAHAGKDQQVEINQLLVLDGSGSKDEASLDFEYLWTIKNQPENSEIVLTETTTISPKFKANTAGTYVLELKISNDHFSDTDEVIILVKDASGEPSLEPVIIDQDIWSDRTLVNLYDDPAIPDYLITEDVHVSALLVIEPSVTIAFAEGKALNITYQGILRAEGWLGMEVVFTGKEKTPGYWKGIMLASPNEQNLLKHSVVEYAGSQVDEGAEFAANLLLDGASGAKLTVLESSFRHSKVYGLVIEPGALLSAPKGDVLMHHNQRPALIPASHMKAPQGIAFDNEVNMIDVLGESINETEVIFWSPAIDNSSPARFVPFRIIGKLSLNSGLNILPGTHLMFDAHAELLIGQNAYLVAVGTSSDPIRFHGAEPNETGYWKGISFNSADERNELKHVQIYGAGSQSMEGFEQAAAIALEGDRQAKLKLSNSMIGRSGGHGLYVENKAEITTCFFNKFGYNSRSALALPANEVDRANGMIANEFVGNGHNGIEIFASVLLKTNQQESIWPALNFGASYLVSGNLGIQTGLKLLPGAVLKFSEGKGLKITGNAYLNAQGTDDQPISFRGTSPTRGWWNGIHFQSNNPSNVLHHTVIEHAGMKGTSSLAAASIYVGENVASRLSIAQSRIAHGAGYGISLNTALGTINHDFKQVNTFEDLSLGAVFQQ